jgi:ABC-2 type transport system permease protein
MTHLKPYFFVLYQLVLNAIAKIASFRFNVILNVIVELSAFFTTYLTARFVFDHVDQIGPWNRSQFMLYIFWYQTVMCVHSSVLAPNFWNFSTEVRTGSLDFRLLRPLGSVFDVFTAIQRPASLLIVPLNVALLIHYGIETHLTTIAWILLPLLIAISLALVFLIEMSISMSVFWTTSGDGINFLRMQGQQLQKWPDFIYPRGIRRLFSTVLPILIAITFPVRFVFDQREWMGIVWTLVAIALFWFACAFLWRQGLKKYESASS